MSNLRIWTVSYGAAASGLRVAAVFLAILAAAPVVHSQAVAPTVADLSAARQASERAHLWRVGVWGAANGAVGTVLLATSRRDVHPGRRAFGIQTAAWGAVNVGIAVFALSRSGEADSLTTLAEALHAENRLGDVLWLNIGLDAGYAAVGATLWAVASRGVSNPAAWRGHGQALILQGAALLALDAVVLIGSQERMDTLLGLAQTVAVVPTGQGLALIVPF
jgi:hypothetical protein